MNRPDFTIEPERYEFFEALENLEATRREFFRIAGGGVIVALLLGEEEALAQRKGGQFGGGGPQEIGAWIHVGEDGAITGYSGKVEIGQNVRTSLAQVVAEELRVPFNAVRMVLADTDKVPPDMGTFGSQSTRQMGGQLKRAGAAMRDALIELAAKKAEIDRDKFTVADGKVAGPDGKPAFTFGELTKGQKVMKVIARDVAVTKPADWKVAGTSAPKADGRDFVTGSHQYASDVRRPGMVFGKILRPPAFGAKLKDADTKPAEGREGVSVVHEKDFIGVTAPTAHEATAALTLIKADWTTTTQLAGKDLFKHLKESRGGGGRGGGGGFGGGGGGAQGNIGTGLQAADQTVKATYTIAYIAHVPLEPRAAVAEWNDGKLTVWTGTQGPFRVRTEVATAVGVAPDKVRVIIPDMGSGYGGKHSGEAAVEAARLAKAVGTPVKVAWTREEEFTWAYFRPAGVIEVNAGAAKDGTLTAWEFHNYNSGGSAIRTPYTVANVNTQFHGSDSPLRQGSYRALASTANVFARESAMDELAAALKMDPLEFRLKNLKDARLKAVFEAAARKFGWGAKPAPGHGFGIGGGTEKGSYVATCAEVAVEKEKVRVVRVVTAFECGAVVNPDHLKNQVEGAVIMGLGGALFEAIEFDNGKILNPAFSSYRLPRFKDAPPVLETVLVDRKDLPSEGAGETPIVGIAPAVGNAIFWATGTRLRSMPLVPDGLKT
jgi:isoquinoline 1-oxidoreductase